ncbi:MAG: glycosyltransferase family 2 protein [Planctomycetaceae bacterium]|nr:glycosyltransferase family 2 protein [Planctomycetaceae bacterium]
MLSIVIPVYNEEGSLVQLHREMCKVADEQNYETEIIFVDDGSRDRSWEIIEMLAKDDSRIRAIRFRRNFGKAAALNAGFETARGELVMTLDADLQDDPNEIPEFVKMMDTSLDVVSGWKQVRHDPWHKVWPSRLFNGMVSWLTGVKLHDHNCGMKMYRRQIFDEITLYGELHRFVPVLAAARGYTIGEKVVQHRARTHGKSKYGFTRFVKGFLDLLTVKFITGYGQRPQHFMGTCGLISFAIGLFTMFYYGFRRVLSGFLVFIGEVVPEDMFLLRDHPGVIFSVAFLLFGAQLVTVGIIAELFISYQNRRTNDYSIAEVIHSREEQSDRMVIPKPHFTEQQAANADALRQDQS